jgi:hypothetical protein
MVVRISPIAMNLAGIGEGFRAYIQGHDLVLCASEITSGTWVGEYKFRRNNSISIPSAWVEKEGIVNGSKIGKFLDSKGSKTFIRLRIVPA